MLLSGGNAVALVASFALLAHAEPLTDSIRDRYDFIVVGGGTAGLAVASRLSQGLQDKSILVLEAGPDAPDEPKINVPGMKGQAIGSIYDWNLTSTAQPNAGDREIAQTRGKVLGGSSAINLMSWDRGSSFEYDTWESLGNDGWNWRSMLSSMLGVENFLKSPLYGDIGVGFGGPVETMINDYIPLQQESWMPTLENLGILQNLVSLGGDLLGTMFQPSNIRNSDSTRSYSAHNPGYPSIAGENLHIRTDTRVAKINFHQRGPHLVATGVTLEDESVIHATKEVILSAGTLQSPGLLELSGIGQKDVLSAAGVAQILDLPGVGEHFQDHMRIQNSYRLKPGYTSFDILKFNSTYASEQLAAYNAGERSIYDYTGSGYAFASWSQALDDPSDLISLARDAVANPLTSSPFEKERSRILLDYLTERDHIVPEIEVIFSDGYTGAKGYPAEGTPLHGSYFFTLIGALQHAFSIGSVHITSSSISSPPTINPNYLGHEYDVQGLANIAKYMRKIASTEPLKNLVVDEYEPGLDVVGDGPDADEQWKQYTIANSNTLYHPVGTCAMLPKKLNGVVDPQLKVYGTKNLRVVDASVIPNLVSGHIQTAVFGVAEKAAKIIIDRWDD